MSAVIQSVEAPQSAMEKTRAVLALAVAAIGLLAAATKVVEQAKDLGQR